MGVDIQQKAHLAIRLAYALTSPVPKKHQTMKHILDHLFTAVIVLLIFVLQVMFTIYLLGSTATVIIVGLQVAITLWALNEIAHTVPEQ